MHVSVLPEEVLHYINAKDGERFIDGTAGAGGYMERILAVNSKARILGIDLDQTSLDNLKQKFVQRNLIERVTLVHGSYSDMLQIGKANDFLPVSGIVLDLGFSSDQIDDPKRGFSFQGKGPLDMRYNKTQKLTAADVVNTYAETKLAKILYDYGEDKFAKKIARSIVQRRGGNPIANTHDLLGLIEESLPKPIKHKAQDVARRIFQAIRIEVNGELDSLREVLPDTLEALETGGRLVVIAFHSLEDRIVKEFMREASRGCICPAEFPTCICGKEPKARMLTKKPVTATDEELNTNPRSKPAKLRALVKN